MERNQRIAAFTQLGRFLTEFTDKHEWRDYSNGVSRADHDEFNGLIESAYTWNPWFTPAEVRRSIAGIASWLRADVLEAWLRKYPAEPETPKTVAIIMAGNIPLVGFHDVMSVLLSGNRVLCKFSSDDNKLFPLVLKYLVQIEPEFYDFIRVADNRVSDFHAVIATGSNNSSRYFEKYFEKYPHIIRKNRTSVAVITGEESDEELEALGHDIFDYFGLGCRNVGKIFIPRDFNLDRIFKAIFPFGEIINHNRYANNYDYHKALYLLNRDDLLENGFVLFKEDHGLHSPLAVIFYERYDDRAEVTHKLEGAAEEIQCIVGREFIPFGKSQQPAVDDYADGVDVMHFLSTLSA